MTASGFCLCEERTDKPPAKLVPYRDRSCTDVLFLILFIAGWIGIIILFSTAVKDGGDPNKIVRPVQFDYKICGLSVGVEDKPYALWPYPLEYAIKICVNSCDETQTNPLVVQPLPGYYVSKRFVYYCVPNFNGTVELKVSGDFDNVKQASSRAAGDIFTAWAVILISGFIALLFSFLYVFLTRFIAAFLVWLAILAAIVGGFILAYALLSKASDYEDTQVDQRAQVVRGLGWAVVVITVLFIFLVIGLRNRIRIAIAVIEEAAAALGDIKSLVFFPAIPILMGGCYFVWWIFVTLYIFSVGKTEEKPMPSIITNYWQSKAPIPINNGVVPQNYTDFTWDESLKNAFAANFFHLLWNIEFLIYFTFMVSAGAVANWYFTPYNADGTKPRGGGDNELSNFPVRDSLLRTIRYHLGSIALGSAIIAIIQFIRAFVKYLEEKSKVADQNRIQRAMFCMVQCCLWCLECCMDKVNRNAFIWIAIWGDNFGVAACSSFSLLWRNLARVAAINLVGHYLMLLGKIIVAMSTTGICAIIFISYDKYKDELSSLAMPCAVIFLLSYMVSSVFMVAFDTTIDTTFLCFLVDYEHNGNNMFASLALQEIVNRHKEDNNKAAERVQSLRNFKSTRNLAAQPGPVAVS